MGKFKYKSPEIGENTKKLIERDKSVYFGAHTRSREIPLAISKAEGVRITDLDGNVFLDFGAGYAVASTGHCHPEVVEAIRKQAGELIHHPGSDFYLEYETRLCEELVRLSPGNFPKQVYLASTGAEAIDSALKVARYYTKRPKFISFFGAFHGRTFAAMSVCGSKKVQRRGFGPLLPEVVHTLYPYCYRCPLRLNYPDCKAGMKKIDGIPLLPCVAFLTDSIFKSLVDPSEVAAIIVEPIQGEGGYIVPPPEFHKLLRAITAKYDIILIEDDIQAGLGRTGKMFATENWEVAADVNIVAKGIASGVPMSAIIARSHLMDPGIDSRAWVPGSHGSTFGGNAIACAAALKTIELIENEYMDNAKTQGDYILARLNEMKENHSIIGDVRGLGLMIGIEIVQNKVTKEPFTEDFTEDGKNIKAVIVGEAYKRGLIIFGCGFNSIRISPPLSVTRKEVEECIDIFEEVITYIESNLQ
ncbi:aminotransferase class III-fold pyridoxal phosphate-dependent enzyme [bacterium]|nr:aminotransferase class III-fold pyridoxal phosphate-dependent enzyme [bacterium]